MNPKQTATTKVDYYYIIGKMPHTISDQAIELRPIKTKEGNVLKQFSDLFDEALSTQSKEFQLEKEKLTKEILQEVPCPQLTGSNVLLCKCEWCKSVKKKFLKGDEK